MFVKCIAIVLLSVIIGITLTKQGKDISLALSIAVCCMVATVAISYLEPVKDLILKIEQLGNLNRNMVTIILKAIGVGFLAQITTAICNDAGNAALGKTLQFLACAVLLSLSVPLLQELLAITESILQNL